jgi:hypothetical protein
MALFSLYILPSLIAIIRGTENLGWIIVLNLVPTGVGWLVPALHHPGQPAQALTSPTAPSPG